MARRDALACVVVACAACCGGHSEAPKTSTASGTGSVAPAGSGSHVVTIVSRGGGKLAGVGDASGGFVRTGDASTDGTVALIEAVGGVVRIPIGKDARLALAPGHVYSQASPMVITRPTQATDAALSLASADGAQTIEVPGASGGVVVAPVDGGMLRVARDGGDLLVQRYGADGKIAIDARAPAPSAAAQPVEIAARGGVAVIVLVDGTTTYLVGVGAGDGKPRWTQTAGAYTYGFAVADPATFAITIADPSQCEACSRAEVRAFADGAVVHEAALGTAWQRDGGGNLGYDGEVVWVYRYRAPGTDDVLGTHHEASCTYGAYALGDRSGKPVRSAADARWRDLGAGCTVRALVNAPDGRVIAIRAPAFDTAEALVLSGTP